MKLDQGFSHSSFEINCQAQCLCKMIDIKFSFSYLFKLPIFFLLNVHVSFFQEIIIEFSKTRTTIKLDILGQYILSTDRNYIFFEWMDESVFLKWLPIPTIKSLNCHVFMNGIVDPYLDVLVAFDGYYSEWDSCFPLNCWHCLYWMKIF